MSRASSVNDHVGAKSDDVTVSPTPVAGHESPAATLADQLPAKALDNINEKLATEPPAAVPAQANVQALTEEERLARMPQGVRLYLLMLGLFMAVYVVSLDQTIVSPAIPIISNQFHALADVGWYGSAYFATSTALQPLYGRLYRLNLKWPYVSCLVIFEVGSLICALAKNSKMFIVGRAIAGVGVAGGYIGTLTIVAASVPLNKVPIWSGMIGAVYGMGAITGPLIGGVFTSEVTWRWCFYLSLPLGGVTILVVFLFFHPPHRNPMGNKTILQLLFSLDISGAILTLAAMVCLLLALQDGGISKDWNTSREIGLLVGAGAIAIAFVLNEYLMKDDAMIPLRILTGRTIGFGAIANFGIGASYFSAAIFLPIFFQLRGSSSIRSGVQLLPLVCGVIFAVTVAGGSTPAIGYVQPALFFGAICGIVGAGLFQLFDAGTSQPYWIGVEFLFGLGIGAAFQMPFIISQTVGKGLETEVGSSIVIFFQTLGGALTVAASQSIFANIFKHEINNLTIPGLNQAAIIAAGETGFRNLVTPEQLGPVLDASMVAVRAAFIPTVVGIGIALLASLPLPFNSVKGTMAGAGGA